jgi:hypothetical protein
LSGENSLKSIECLVVILGDIGISMQAKDFRGRVEGEFLDELSILVVFLVGRGEVDAGGREFIVVVKDLITVEILKDGG